MSFFKNNFLLFVVFLTGALVLVVEIVGMRILSPYFGSSLFTVSSVLSIILAALSLGYYLGGKRADKKPSRADFFRLIYMSGLCVLGLHLVGIVVLPLLSLVLPVTLGPLVSALILFFLPALLLGMLSPYVIKLMTLQFPESGIGTLSGRVFFWSTIGSITGSILAGFVLIPRIGVNEIMISSGVFLFLLGLIPFVALKKRKVRLSVMLFIFLLASLVVGTQEQGALALYSNDGVYEKLAVYDVIHNERPGLLFKQDAGNSGGMFTDDDSYKNFMFDYAKYYSLYRVFTPQPANTLVIGGGIYTIPRALYHEIPQAAITVSEIEPSLPWLAETYFDLPNDERIAHSTEDGRRFLQQSEPGEYDLIFSDVYDSLFSVPAHFTTQEFFELGKSRLATDGIFLVNAIGDLPDSSPSLLLSHAKTFRSVFPNSYFFKLNDGNGVSNFIFAGYNSDQQVDFTDPEIQSMLTDVIPNISETYFPLTDIDLDNEIIFTDNFTPVEYLTSKVLKRSRR